MQIHRIILIFILISSCAISQESSRSNQDCLVRYYFTYFENVEQRQVDCEEAQDSLSAAAHIWQSSTNDFLKKHSNLHFRFLEIYDFSSKQLPTEFSNKQYYEQLWIVCPQCKEVDSNYLFQFENLSDLRINANTKKMPNCFYELSNLDTISFILNRNTELDSNRLLPRQAKIETNLKMTENNARLISSSDPIELVLVEQKKIRSYLGFLKDVPKVIIYGKLNKKEIEKLRLLIPHAIYHEAM